MASKKKKLRHNVWDWMMMQVYGGNENLKIRIRKENHLIMK